MANKLQCPQCGASSSTKISETEYHCQYCDSNFKIGMTREDLLSAIRSKPKGTGFDSTPAASPKKKVIIVTLFFVVMLMVFGIAFFASKTRRDSYWGTPSLNKFEAFCGSKGPVVWRVEEFSSRGLDSAKFTLKIINPSNSVVLGEMDYLPAMTWKDGFDSNEFMGEFYGFGDTCWITSERDGLIARDIYSGKIIVDAQKLGQLFPKLAGGVSKVSYASESHSFTIMSSDGLEYIFNPNANKLFTKEEFKKANDVVTAVRSFFVISEGVRPHLFRVVENTSPFAAESKAFSHDLEKYDGVNFSELFNTDIISVTKLNPGKIYFNGKIIWQDTTKTVILSQENTNEKSGMLISCVNTAGKEIWSLDKKSIKDFSDAHAENNYTLEFISFKNKLIMYFQYPVTHAMQIDLGSGKTDWTYNGEK